MRSARDARLGALVAPACCNRGVMSRARRVLPCARSMGRPRGMARLSMEPGRVICGRVNISRHAVRAEQGSVPLHARHRLQVCARASRRARAGAKGAGVAPTARPFHAAQVFETIGHDCVPVPPKATAFTETATASSRRGRPLLPCRAPGCRSHHWAVLFSGRPRARGAVAMLTSPEECQQACTGNAI